MSRTTVTGQPVDVSALAQQAEADAQKALAGTITLPIAESDVTGLVADLGAKLVATNNLSDLDDLATAVTNLNTDGDLMDLINSSTAFDAAGAAATAQSNAEAYADGLAPNYDPAGAAATAQGNAEGYAAAAVAGVSAGAIGAAIAGYQDGGGYCVSVGVGSSAANGYYSVVVGAGAALTAPWQGACSVVIGSGANTGWGHTVAIGCNATLGYGATGGIAIGSDTTANIFSIALGYQASATSNSTIALGYLSTASAYGAIAIGPNASASNRGQVVISTPLHDNDSGGTVQAVQLDIQSGVVGGVVKGIADFCGNAVKAPSLQLSSHSTPSNPTDGQIYWNGTHLYIYKISSTSWVQII